MRTIVRIFLTIYFQVFRRTPTDISYIGLGYYSRSIHKAKFQLLSQKSNYMAIVEKQNYHQNLKFQ